jgi:hypothetical protein
MPSGSRGVRWQLQFAAQAKSRPVNSAAKKKERTRRDALLKELLQKGKLPYTPTVMSWLSEKLGKKSQYITQEDVQKYLKG